MISYLRPVVTLTSSNCLISSTRREFVNSVYFVISFCCFVGSMDTDDKFPLHAAAREGRGMLNEFYNSMTGITTNR